MSYAIVGFGAVGQALARAFARKNIEVAVASRRPPQALVPQALVPQALVAVLADQLGFAPVDLGKLEEGGALVHARDKRWGPLIFQDLFKKEP